MQKTIAEVIEVQAGIHEMSAFRVEGSDKWHVARWNKRESQYEFFTRSPVERPTTRLWGRTLAKLADESLPGFSKDEALRRAQAGRSWR